MRLLWTISTALLLSTAARSNGILDRSNGDLWYQPAESNDWVLWTGDDRFDSFPAAFSPFDVIDPKNPYQGANFKSAIQLRGRVTLVDSGRVLYQRHADAIEGVLPFESDFLHTQPTESAEYYLIGMPEAQRKPGLVIYHLPTQSAVGYHDLQGHMEPFSQRANRALTPAPEVLLDPGDGETLIGFSRYENLLLVYRDEGTTTHRLSIPIMYGGAVLAQADGQLYLAGINTPSLSIYRLNGWQTDEVEAELVEIKTSASYQSMVASNQPGTIAYRAFMYTSPFGLGFISYDLASKTETIDLSCVNSQNLELQRSRPTDPRWIYCDRTFYRLQNQQAKPMVTIDLPQTNTYLRKAQLLYDDGEEFEIVAEVTGEILRIRGDSSVKRARLSAFRRPPYTFATVWTYRDRICGISTGGNTMLCEHPDGWRALDEDSPLMRARSSYRLGSSLWVRVEGEEGFDLLRFRDGQNEVERYHTGQTSWQFVRALHGRLRISDRDQVYGFNGSSFELEDIVTGLGNIQALDRDGTFYGSCSHLEEKICAKGVDKIVHETGVSNNVSLVPLKRGVLTIASGVGSFGNSSAVLRGGNWIQLHELHGEARFPSSMYVQAVESPKTGHVYLVGKATTFDPDTGASIVTTALVEFDGSVLHRFPDSIGAASTERIDFEPIPLPGSGRPLRRYLWQESNLLWYASALGEAYRGPSRPYGFGATPKQALLPSSAADGNHITAGTVVGEQAILAEKHGIWSCPLESGSELHSETPRLWRTPGCTQLAVVHGISNMLAIPGSSKVIVQQGSSIFELDTTKAATRRLLASNASHLTVLPGDQALWVEQGAGIVRYDLSSGARTIASQDDFAGKGLIGLTDGHACTKQGIWSYPEASRSVWEQDCLGIATVDDQTFALTKTGMIRCQSATCSRHGQPPYRVDTSDRLAAVLVDGQYELLLSQRNRLFRWSQREHQFEEATPQYGTDHRSAVRGPLIHLGSFIGTEGGGAISLGTPSRHFRLF